MKKTAISSRLEDYLEYLFGLEIRGEEPTITGLARELNITKGAATQSIKRMASLGLLTHKPYGRLHLTEEGFSRGLSIFRRHEHLSFFFSEMLGIPRNEAEEIACSMEHSMQEESEQRLLALAEFYCSSKRNGEDWTVRLQEALEQHRGVLCPLPLLAPRTQVRIARITAQNPIREKLLNMGVVPDKTLTFLKIDQDGEAQILVNGKYLSLNRTEASTVWVCSPEQG